MTKPDWPSIKRDYVETRSTLADVQARWGVPRGTLSARASREGWNDLKQQFAAKLEQTRQETIITQAAAEQAKFQSTVLRVAQGQLAMIMRKMNEFASDAAADASMGKHEAKRVDAAVLLKLTNALANVQRVGSASFGTAGTANRGAPPLEGGSAAADARPSEDVLP